MPAGLKLDLEGMAGEGGWSQTLIKKHKQNTHTECLTTDTGSARKHATANHATVHKRTATHTAHQNAQHDTRVGN